MSDLKTLFLIRHAESMENERIASLQRSISNVGRLSLPRMSDLRRSVELINVPAQVDSDVSAVGWDQVRRFAGGVASFVVRPSCISFSRIFQPSTLTTDKSSW